MDCHEFFSYRIPLHQQNKHSFCQCCSIYLPGNTLRPTYIEKLDRKKAAT